VFFVVLATIARHMRRAEEESSSLIRWMKAALAATVCVSGLSLAVAADTAPMPEKPTGIRPILIGAEAPALVLKNSSGVDVDLARVLEKRATILVFYRAHW